MTLQRILRFYFCSILISTPRSLTYTISTFILYTSFLMHYSKLLTCSLSSKLTPPSHERGIARLTSAAMLSILSFYRNNITDNMPPNCRFFPSCSSYMVEAITTYGAWRGFILSTWRIIRCNPTGGSGYDPVTWPPVSYNAGTWNP